jgi:hypothetical protein
MTHASSESRSASPFGDLPDPAVTDPAALGQTILLDGPVTDEALVDAGVALRPSPRQLAWQRLEVTAFLHFGVNTYTGHEWGDGREDPSIFAPEHLDCDQWARELAAAGARLAILTIKHHDGFVLYPSRYTDHSVRASSWRDGHGDVLEEFTDACRAHGLRVGVYISPADEHEFRYGRYANGSARTVRSIPSPVPGDDRPADGPRFALPATDYGTYMLDQLYEVLTEYGPIDVVWFDGANGMCPTTASRPTTSTAGAGSSGSSPPGRFSTTRPRTHAGSATRTGSPALTTNGRSCRRRGPAGVAASPSTRRCPTSAPALRWPMRRLPARTG